MNYRKSAFTLVELMVVIVIIAALMLIALPTFQGANRGGRLRTAAFQMSTTISLARQTAIGQRQTVYVLLPNNNAALFAGQPREAEKAFRAYAPYGKKSGYLGEWMLLPPGIVFNDIYDAYGENVFARNWAENIPFPTTNSAPQEMIYVPFRPDGAVDEIGSSSVVVFLSEGIVEADLQVGTAGFPIIKTNTTILAVDVLGVTGRIRMREYAQ